MTDNAICPNCGKPALVNVYTGLKYYVQLRGDGHIKGQITEGGVFDSTYCEECEFSTADEGYHDLESRKGPMVQPSGGNPEDPMEEQYPTQRWEER